ncbi:AAA family ATPase [Tumebacillus permanentifrigoris]|uniref:AAA ATPase-like protein n=1 Tax=Tumebacillus permanentifrigoris TaxID=378543 RepID=A0A316D3G1_9BACL|nr:AAA family ATPase [Tumebacillus permanentifrigoris]PWK05963.1 AAA ATPase-like protein [Tumebacillus permanentifrigoris]
MLQYRFQNLGPIETGEVQVKNLTILCGENNTGKTYGTYAIYGLSKELSHLEMEFPELIDMQNEDVGEIQVDLEDALDQLDTKLDTVCFEFSRNLFRLFSVKFDAFASADIGLQVDIEQFKNVLRETEYNSSIHYASFGRLQFLKKLGTLATRVISTGFLTENKIQKQLVASLGAQILSRYVISDLFSETFLLPAERSGMNLFFKELNASRNELVHDLGIGLVNDDLLDVRNKLEQNISPYAVPISDYLQFLNRLELYANQEGPFVDIAREIQTNIIKGTYEVKNQQVFYINQDGKQINLHVSSSTVKSLFGLVFYLTYMAKKGAYLIIDEPELNLHPDNQRKLARALAKAANRGLHVIISTHSDYMVKEFNNLLMLSKLTKNREEIMQKYGYTEDELLKPTDVAPYLFIENRIEPMLIDPNEGIIAETFDKVINSANQAADDIYYSLQEEQQDGD